MSENIIAACQIVGFLFLLACSIVGAYVWLRWGYQGVSMIWQQRINFDSRVEDEALQTWMRRRNSGE